MMSNFEGITLLLFSLSAVLMLLGGYYVSINVCKREGLSLFKVLSGLSRDFKFTVREKLILIITFTVSLLISYIGIQLS